jgi:hypothetical protein
MIENQTPLKNLGATQLWIRGCVLSLHRCLSVDRHSLGPHRVPGAHIQRAQV